MKKFILVDEHGEKLECRKNPTTKKRALTEAEDAMKYTRVDEVHVYKLVNIFKRKKRKRPAGPRVELEQECDCRWCSESNDTIFKISVK